MPNKDHELTNTLFVSFYRHNKHSKDQEKAVLEQGLPPMHDSPSEDPLPPPVPLTPSLLPAPVNLTPHHFTLPDNTAGQSAAVRAQQSTIIPLQTIQPLLHPAPFVYILPNQQPSSTPTPSPPTPNVPYSMQSYRKKKLSEEKSSVVPTKRYKERTGPSTAPNVEKQEPGSTNSIMEIGTAQKWSKRTKRGGKVSPISIKKRKINKNTNNGVVSSDTIKPQLFFYVLHTLAA